VPILKEIYMEIRTKYAIGHVFYVARSYRRTKQIKQRIGDVEWVSEQIYYEPVVRQKIIVGLEVSMFGKYPYTNDYNVAKSVKYYVEDIDHAGGDYVPRLTDEEQITTYSYEDALTLAREYAANMKELF